MSTDLHPEHPSKDRIKRSRTRRVFDKLAGALHGKLPESKPEAPKSKSPEECSPLEQKRQIKENIKKLWGQTLNPSALPGATLKISSLAPRPSLPSHIPPRQFALPQQTNTTHADYTVLDKIADGGMGCIFVGLQTSLKRRVAIKTIKDDAANNQDSCTQFLTEALVTGDLDHPNIVPIYELGTNGDGLYFYAMKHVRGISWDECIQHKSKGENLDILMKVCDAVAFAHSRGIIHRDLKPENIMIGEFGEVLLMDWGLASPAQPGDKSELFGPGSTLGGTPAYMSPECARGEGDKIGSAADVYLIGAILFEIISGKAPHDKLTVEESLEAAVQNEIPELDIQSELLSIALKAMETETVNRYDSVLELQQNIRNYRQHEESLTLTSNAEDNYTRARVNESYGEYSAGMHACYEALKLWEDNEIARELRNNIRLDYARLSMKREDYDLCLTLLKAENPEDLKLIRRARRKRDERTRRLELQKKLKYALSGTVLVTLLVMAAAYNTVSKQRSQAIYDNFITQTRLAEALLRYGDWKEVCHIAQSIPEYLSAWEWRWLNHASHLKLASDQSFSLPVQQVVASRDGNFRAILFSDHSLKIEAPTSSAEFSFKTPIRDIRWSEGKTAPTLVLLEGNSIFQLKSDNQSRWNLNTLGTNIPPETTILSPSGRLYLTQPAPTEASIYRTESNALVARLKLNENDNIAHAVFSWNENILAGIIPNENRLKIFDVQTGELTEQSAPHSEYTTSSYSRLEFSRDDQLLNVIGLGRVIYFCNVRHLNPRVTLPLKSQPTAMALSPDGESLLATTSEGEVVVFHIPTASNIWDVELPDLNIAHIVGTKPGGEWKLYDQTGNRYSFSEAARSSFQIVTQQELPILGMHWSTSTSTLIARDQRSTYRQVNTQDGTSTDISLLSGRRIPDTLVTINAQDHLLSLDPGHGLQIVNLHNGKRKLLPQFENFDALSTYKHLLLLSSREQLVLLDLITETTLNSWDIEFQNQAAIQLLDESTAWIGGQNTPPIEFNLKTGIQKALEKPLYPTAFWIPDSAGNSMIAHSRSRNIHIYNLKSGKITNTLSDSKHVITGITASPDGRRLLASSADGHILIWDTQTWQFVMRFRAHNGTATSLALTPDGARLFTSGTDGTIRVWQAPQQSPHNF